MSVNFKKKKKSKKQVKKKQPVKSTNTKSAQTPVDNNKVAKSVNEDCTAVHVMSGTPPTDKAINNSPTNDKLDKNSFHPLRVNIMMSIRYNPTSSLI